MSSDSLLNSGPVLIARFSSGMVAFIQMPNTTTVLSRGRLQEQAIIQIKLLASIFGMLAIAQPSTL